MSVIQEERQSPSKLAAVLKDLEEKTQQGMASINEHNQKLKETMETLSTACLQAMRAYELSVKNLCEEDTGAIEDLTQLIKKCEILADQLDNSSESLSQLNQIHKILDAFDGQLKKIKKERGVK